MKDKVAESIIERAHRQRATGRTNPGSEEGETRLGGFLERPDKTSQSTKRLGEVLRGRGLLNDIQVAAITTHQDRHQVTFGAAARQLGYVSDDAIKQALATQFDYPLLSPGDQSLSPELVAAYCTDGAYIESLRRLRSDLLADLPRFQTRILAVVSPRRGEGRTHLVGNLAIAFAQLGKKVLVIDANLREPRMQELFKVSNDVGISLLLSGRECSAPVREVPHFPCLNLLTTGPLPPNPQELVSGDRMLALVGSAKPRYDVILIDTPAAATYADAENIAQIAGSALIVARRNKTKMLQLIPLARRLKKKKVCVAGTVLVS